MARFDRRWAVVADRYDPPAACNAPPRSAEDLKARYYGVARQLVVSRCDDRAEVAHVPLVKHPYDADAEAERRTALSAAYSRTAEEEAADAAAIAEGAVIEAKRRAEVAAAKAAGAPLPAYALPPTQPAAEGASRVAVAPIDPHADPGGPSLPTPRGVSMQPPPGKCYIRGLHTVAVAGERTAARAAAALAASGRARDKRHAEAAVRRVEMAMEEFGVGNPKVPTRAVCRAWWALRCSVEELMELRSQLAKKAKDPTTGGGDHKRKADGERERPRDKRPKGHRH